MAEPVNGGNGSQAAERNVDGGAAAARLPPDGRGDVRLPVLLQEPDAAARAKKTAPPTASRQTRRTPPGAPATPPPSLPPAAAQAEAAPAPRRHRPSKAQPPLVIETDLYRVTFSNQGANVRSWLLKKYKGNDNKPLELMNTASGLVPVLALLSRRQSRPQTSTGRGTTQTADPDGLGVTYEYSDGHTTVRKVLPLREEQLPLEGLDRGHARRQAVAAHDRVARRLRRPDRRQSRRPISAPCTSTSPQNKLRRRPSATPRAARSPAATSPSPASPTPISPRCSCPKAPVRPSKWSRSPTRVRTVARTKSRRILRASPSRDGDGQSLRAVRRPQGSRPAGQGQSEARAGGGFRLALRPRQAAVPDRQLVQRQPSSTTSAGPSCWSPSSSTSSCSR